MTAALPGNMSFGRVRGRYGTWVLAAGDADGKPDFTPLEGMSVIFTPTIAVLKNPGASPPITLLMTNRVVCTIDGDGYLISPDGREGVYLVATDDADTEPSGWKYAVSFDGSANYQRLRSFEITVPGGSTQWLTATQPAP